MIVLMAISLHGNTILYIVLSDELAREATEFPSRISICLVVILITAFVAYKILRISKNQEQQNISNYPEKWRFLFEIYRPGGYFLLIYILRVTCLSLILVYLSEYPEIQAILIILVSFAMLLYLILRSPIAKKISSMQHMIIEAGLLFYNGVVAILVVFGLENDEMENFSGQVMIILYLMTSLITALIIIIKFFYNIWNLLFKTRNGLQTGHIHLRELSQGSSEEETDESLEQQEGFADESSLREIHQQGKEKIL